MKVVAEAPDPSHTNSIPEGDLTTEKGAGEAGLLDLAPVPRGVEVDAGRFGSEGFFVGGFLFAGGVTRPVPPWPCANHTPLEINAVIAQATRSAGRVRPCENQLEFLLKAKSVEV